MKRSATAAASSIVRCWWPWACCPMENRRGTRVERFTLRGGSSLASVSRLPGRPWTARRGNNHQRCPRRSQVGSSGSLSHVPWQRCQFHLQRNAAAYVPKVDTRREVAADLRGVLNAPDMGEAERLLELSVEKYCDSTPSSPSEWRPTCPKDSPFSRDRSHTAGDCEPPICRRRAAA